jgi:hypothetical protein
VGLDGLHGHARFPQPGQARVPKLAAGAVAQSRTASGTGEDFIQTGGGQW